MNFSKTQNKNEETNETNHVKESGFEFRIVTRWFSRLGMLLLLCGIALALKDHWALLEPYITNEVKLLLTGLLATGFYVGGCRLHPKQSLWGRLLQGGGLALGYLTLFGMFFIPEVSIIDQPSIGWPLLMVASVAMFFVAQRFQSFSITLMSLAFGYYTAVFCVGSGAVFGSNEVMYGVTTLLNVLLIASLFISGKMLSTKNDSAFVSDEFASERLTSVHQLILFFVAMVGSVFIFLVGLNDSAHTLYVADGLNRAFLWTQFAVFYIGSFLLNVNRAVLVQTILTAACYLLHQALFSNTLGGGLLEALLMVGFFGVYVFNKYAVDTENDTPVFFVNQNDEDHHQRARQHVLMTLLFMSLCVIQLLAPLHFAQMMQPVLFAVFGVALSFVSSSAPEKNVCTFASYTYIVLGATQLMLMPWHAVNSFTFEAVIMAVFACFLVQSRVLNNQALTTEGKPTTVLADTNLSHLVSAPKHDDSPNLRMVYRVAMWAYLSIVLMVAFFCHFGAVAASTLTLAFVLMGSLQMSLGVMFKNSEHTPFYRWAGLVWMFIGMSRLLLLELPHMWNENRMLLLLGSGLALMAVSWVYQRFASAKQDAQKE